MVDIFWITDQEKYKDLRNYLEMGTRESIKTLTIEKLEKLKDDLPSFSIICFEVNQQFYDFWQKHEFSLSNYLIAPICPVDQVEELSRVMEGLSTKSDFHMVINPDWNYSLTAQNFRTLIKLSQLSRSTQDFSLVGKQVNKLVSSTLDEVDRLRKLHERLVVLRQENIKGLNVTSKFSAGKAPGGEFFDMIKGEGEMLVFLSTSSSYVTTGVLLTHIDYLRELKKFEEKDLKKYIELVSNDLSGVGNTKLDLMFIIIENKNLKTKIYNFGQAVIFGEDQLIDISNEVEVNAKNLTQAFTEIKLERSKKYLIASSGIMKMTAGIINQMPIGDFFKSQSGKDGAAILNELFFHLKKNNTDKFLNRDVSSLLIEVGENVIVQV